MLRLARSYPSKRHVCLAVEFLRKSLKVLLIIALLKYVLTIHLLVVLELCGILAKSSPILALQSSDLELLGWL